MSQTFPIAPGSGSGAAVVLVLVVVIVLGGFAALGRAVLGSTRSTFEVTPSALVLRGDWWGRSLDRSALKASEARIVDLAREDGLHPVLRTLGTAWPGYRAGWFRLADGDKALVYLTDQKRVVVVPTTLGYTLLLSPADPEGLLAALRR